MVEKLTAGLENKLFSHQWHLPNHCFLKNSFTCGSIVRDKKGFHENLKKFPNLTQGDFLIRYD